MQPRRSLRLVAGALVLALPVLSSCGFDKATDRPYTPAAGVNNRDGDVKVLSAVIVSGQPGSGTFVASLSNNSDEDASLTSVAGAGASADLAFSEVDPPIEVAPRGFVNLVNEAPITVTGELGAGDFQEVTLSFASGDSVSVNIPVVYACDEWSGLDHSGETGGSGTEESESPTTEATPAAGEEPYDCSRVLEEEH